MPKRVSPIETIRADIDTVFGSGKPIEECLEELMRHSVWLVLQRVLEDDGGGSATATATFRSRRRRGRWV